MFDPVSGIVSVVGSVASSLIGADASRKAANTQADAANTATNAQLEMYYQSREDTAPWRAVGERMLNTLAQKVATGPGSFIKSPGYDFRLKEGLNAIESSASARGNVLSGATLKALNRYGQDYASNEYQNFLNQYYQSLTPYQSLAGVGQTAAAQNAQNAMATGSNIAQNTLAAGQAQASGAINQANAITGGINSGINNYLLWKYMGQGSTPSGITGAYSTGATTLPATNYFTVNPALELGG